MVTRPYLDLLVKPKFFFTFSGKNIIICILKGKFTFQNEKKKIQKNKIMKKKYVCLPFLKFSDMLPETHLFFIWPYMNASGG